MNFLTLPVSDGQVCLGALNFSVPTAAGKVVMGIRGEDLPITDAGSGLPFVVRVIEPMGSHTLLTGTVEGQMIRVIAPSDRRPAVADVLHLCLPADRISWMDAATGAALARPA